MTVSTNDGKIQYTLTGTTEFATDFFFLDQTHLTVIYTDADGVDLTLVLNTDYSVSGGDPTGTVTFIGTYLSDPPTSGTLTIKRVTPHTQATDFQDGTNFPSDTLEDTLDKLTLISQEMQEDLNRAIKVAVTNTTITSFEPTGASAGYVLRIDLAGTGTEWIAATSAFEGGVLPITQGGTGQITESAARTALGLAIGTDVQAYDADLQALAGLTSAADKLPYFTGSGTAAVTTFTTFARTLVDDANAAASRITLGLNIGSDVQAYDATLLSIAALGSAADKMLYTTDVDTWAEASITSAGRAILDDNDATAQRITLGLGTMATQNANLVSITGGTITGVTIGGMQPEDATLTSIAALGTAADKFLYTTGIDTWTEGAITAAGRALLDDAAASNQRTTLGLGTIATQNSNSVSITGGSITNITALLVDAGGTGATDAATARTNLGVAIGTNVQAWDATLDSLAALPPPGADRLVFWDQSELAYGHVQVSTGLSLTGTTLTATGGGGGGMGALSDDPNPVLGGNLDFGGFFAYSQTASNINFYPGTTGVVVINGNATQSGRLKLTEDSDNGTSGIILAAPASLTADATITFPETTGTVYVSGGTNVTIADGGTNADNEADARANLGLAIGTDVQAYDAELAALAGLTSAADKVPYFTGSGTASVLTCTAAARSILDDTTIAAIKATLGDKTFNVVDYGAVGDGATDDYAAIQAAIDAAEVTGGVIYFPRGVYKINTGLTVQEEGLILQGEGAGDLGYAKGTIIRAGAALAAMIDFSTAARSTAIKDILVDGADTASVGLYIQTPKVVVENCFITQCQAEGIFVVSFTIDILNSSIYDNNGYGIRLRGGSGTNDIKISNCVISANAKSGVYADVTAGVVTGLYLSDCTMENNCDADDASIYAHVDVGAGCKGVFIRDMYHESDVNPSNRTSLFLYRFGSACEKVSIKDTIMTCASTKEFNFLVQVGSASKVYMENCKVSGFNTAAIDNDAGASGSLILNMVGQATASRYDNTISDSGTKLHTLPVQCHCVGGHSTGTEALSGTPLKIPLTQNVSGLSAMYNDANDSITILEDGIYAIQASALAAGCLDGSRLILGVRTSGSVFAQGYAFNGADATGTMMAQVNTTRELSDGDEIYMELASNSGGSPTLYGDSNTTFLAITKLGCNHTIF